MSKQKNKLLVAMCAMCIAFLGVVGALVGVLAASTQSVGSSFSVTYSIGENVAIAVGGLSWVGDNHSYYPAEGEVNWFEGRATNGSGSITQASNYADFYVLNASEVADRGFILESSKDIEFGFEDYRCLIFFCFKNLTDQTIECTITNNCERSNFLISSYYYDYTFSPNVDSFDKEELVSYMGWTAGYGVPCRYDEHNFTISPGAIGVFYLETFGPNNPNQSAYYRSTAENGLSFSFQQYSE